MNTFAAASLVLAAALATTFTRPVAAATPLPGRAVLVVSCGAGHRPSQQAVADLIGSNNAHEVYAARNRLMTQVRSACRKAGIVQVAVVGRATDASVATATTLPASGPIAGN
jgi:hypothetical protein